MAGIVNVAVGAASVFKLLLFRPESGEGGPGEERKAEGHGDTAWDSEELEEAAPAIMLLMIRMSVLVCSSASVTSDDDTVKGGRSEEERRWIACFARWLRLASCEGRHAVSCVNSLPISPFVSASWL